MARGVAWGGVARRGRSLTDYVTFWSVLIVAPYGLVCRWEACGVGLWGRDDGPVACCETSSDRIKGYSYIGINTLYVKNYRVNVSRVSE